MRSAHDYYDGRDDLGVDGGNAYISHASAARSIVESFRAKAVGRRSVDFAQRDLLCHATHRDARCWRYKEIKKNRPPWMFDDLAAFSARDHNQILRLRAFHYDFLLSRFELMERVPSSFRPTIEATMNCWPVGALFERHGGLRPPAFDICKLGHHCPFCFTRNSTAAYRRITTGPLKDPANQLLLLGEVVVTDAQAADLMSSFTTGLDLRRLKNRIFDAMENGSAELGATGGLKTFSSGPHAIKRAEADGNLITFSTDYGNSFRFAMLTEVQAPTVRARRHRKPHLKLPAVLAGSQVQTRWNLFRVRCFNDLREPFFGSFDRAGVFSWPSWSIAVEPQQWMTHVELTKGLHQSDLWGTWRVESPARSRSRRPTVSEQQQVRKRSRRTQIINSRKLAVVDARRNNLRERIDACPVLRNQVPNLGRHQIRALLASHDVQISDRDARWFAGNQLNQ